MELLLTLLDYVRAFTFWQWYIVLFWPYRYVRLIVNVVGHVMYKSIAIPDAPSFSGNDATVIIPTIEDDMERLRRPISSILATNIHELILVTTWGKFHTLEEFAKNMGDSRIKVYHAKVANKRIQLREAIPKVTTKITILVDDDVTWPKTIVTWLLAPFEDPDMGSVGVCQRVTRDRDADLITRCWNWLGECYIHRRNFEISASHYYDGGTSCMSGRTNALRTEILTDHDFLEGLCNEKWGKFNLNADDDNYITRWLVNHDYKTYIQYNEECMLETTLEANPKFLAQCLRWARSNWRSNYTTLFIERNVYRRQWWTIYALYFATFTSLGLVTDPLFFYSYYRASALLNPEHIFAGWTGWSMVIGWYLFTKVVKLTGLFRRYPKDIFYLPVSIVFGLYHGFIKLNALYTWNETNWGSRPDGDVDNQERMTPLAPRAEVMNNPSRTTKRLVLYTDEVPEKEVVQTRHLRSQSMSSISEKSSSRYSDSDWAVAPQAVCVM